MRYALWDRSYAQVAFIDVAMLRMSHRVRVQFKCSNPHAAGDLLKVWLRDLSEPLIPSAYYDTALGKQMRFSFSLTSATRALLQLF